MPFTNKYRNDTFDKKKIVAIIMYNYIQLVLASYI